MKTVMLCFVLAFSTLMVKAGPQQSNQALSQRQIVPFCKKSARRYLDDLVQKDGIHKHTVDGATSLMLAAHFNLMNHVTTSYVRGVDPNYLHPDYKVSALTIAASQGHKRVVSLLAFSTECWEPAAIKASERGHRSVLEVFFSPIKIFSNFDVNVCYKNNTPLVAAIRFGRVETVKFLFACGAEVNHRILDGLTPLDFALQYRNPIIASLLIEKGGVIDDIVWAEDSIQSKIRITNKKNKKELLCERVHLIPALISEYHAISRSVFEDDALIIDADTFDTPKNRLERVRRDQYTFFRLQGQ